MSRRCTRLDSLGSFGRVLRLPRVSDKHLADLVPPFDEWPVALTSGIFSISQGKSVLTSGILDVCICTSSQKLLHDAHETIVGSSGNRCLVVVISKWLEIDEPAIRK